MLCHGQEYLTSEISLNGSFVYACYSLRMSTWPIRTRVGFFLTWFVLTALYLGILEVQNSGVAVIGMTIGLFVPYGVFNFVALTEAVPEFHIFAIIAAALLIVAFVFVDPWATRMGFTGLKKFPLYLVVLFALTFLVDFSLWHAWPSMGMVVQAFTGVTPHFLMAP